jgi:hypothetical protein
MFARLINRSGIVGLTASGILAAALAGCGGQPTDHSDVSVALPDPSVNVSSKATPSATAAPGAATTAAPSTTATPAPASAGGAGGWGTLKGTIVFDGTPPPVKVLQEKGKAAKDPNICAATEPILSERLVVDASTKGVKNVLVYLPRPTAVNEEAKKALVGKNVEFDQKNCIFQPHVLGLMSGETVILKSSDPLNHNVNIKLKASPGNPTIGGGASVPFPISQSERTPGAIICDIHPWMSAWWMVLDHPYFAVTDDKGNFEIKNVPAGAQKVVVWQEAVKGGGFVTPPSGEEVAIKANDATVKDFKIDASKLLAVD